MINDVIKKFALDSLPDIINKNNLNSILTTNSEDDKPFVIIEDWEELGTIQQELNRLVSPETYYKWCITYYNEYGNAAFQRMRFSTNGHAPYTVPEGLFELDDVIEWGFSDEHITCSNCHKAIATTPSYYGHKPRYAIVNDECLCGDCIVNDFEEEYLETTINNPTKAINTAIISEDRLEELGWKKLSKTYNAGIREGNNDDPKKVFNRYKNRIMSDLLFTYESGQFDLDFWLWVNMNQIKGWKERKHEKPASDDAG
jgi:hypothetical protein